MTTRFQTFEDSADSSRSRERIAGLREWLARRGLSGLVVPRADEHQSEYVPPEAERLAWLTGFTGSAGTAVILADRAALVVDGRYALQAPEQVDTELVTPVALATTSVEAWIEQNLGAGALGYDPWLHTSGGVKKLEAAALKAGGRLVALDANPIDALREDRATARRAPAFPHPEALAGEGVAAKLGRIRDALRADRVDVLLVSDPHNLAWAFNLRGADVPHTPLALGYALIPIEARPVLFLDPEKVGEPLRNALEPVADVAAPAGMQSRLAALARDKATIRIDAATGASALARIVEEAGGIADIKPDPITALKAVKNAAEIAGTRAAHLRDGAAMARFLAWLAREAEADGLTEIAAVEALEAFRRDTNLLRDVSFPTISGSGPNGAIVHYRVTRRTDRRLRSGELFLVDSGAQYEDGTTDITRTLAIGAPTPEMRDRFTRVLQGHIAIARAVFPAGTSGSQLDSFARRPLWEAGLDFDHGTGHGVGSFLSVHEGPQRLSKLGTVALEPGMILSNEPGYYKAGAYGIRIENLVLVEPRAIAGGERPMLGFETLTLAPIDRALVDTALLAPEESAWLDGYHAQVRETLSPMVDPTTRVWLDEATAPLTNSPRTPAHPASSSGEA